MRSSRKACRTSPRPVTVRRRRRTTRRFRSFRATPTSWANTNLNFSNVPAALYAGGFHNFGGNGAVDIAQTVQFTVNPGSSNTVVLQWNEPFDSTPPTAVGAPFASGTGTVPDGGSADFTFSGTAGQAVMIFVDGDTTTTGTSIPDIVLELFSPTNVLMATKDTGTNPEFIALELPATGTYTRPCHELRPDSGRRLPVRSIERRAPRAGAVGLQPAVLPLHRTVPRCAGGAEHAHESSARARRHQCNHQRADRDRAREYADAEPQRRGPDPVGGLRKHQPAGVHQLPGSGDLRTQLGGGRDRCRGLSILRAVRA